MKKISQLCDLILAQFSSEAAAARALGWPRQRLNKITTGFRAPTIYEIADIAELLHMDRGAVLDIFL